MKTIKMIIAGLLILSNGFLSGQETKLKKFPAQLSIVYPLGTNGQTSSNYIYNFSINAISGFTGGINGCEIGGIFNLNKGDILGFQAGGIGNLTRGNVEGMQTGGIFSWASNVKGLQCNGILGKADDVKGMQMSGILNISKTANVSVSGIANVNKETVKGVQIAGIFNMTKELDGIQIGLINVVDTVKRGCSIGLISIPKKGFYDEWSVSAADYLNLGISYKAGTKSFYNIYTLGTNFLEEQLWVAGLGFGHIKEINPNYSLQPELVCYTYYPQNFKNIRETYSTHLKLGIVRNINKNLAVFFAPDIYCTLKSREGKYSVAGYKPSFIKPVYSYDKQNKNSAVEIGFGFSVGINIK